MSNLINEMMLEKFFDEFIEEGLSEEEAAKLAHEKLENIPTP
jgi:pyrroline-5-carboxylate reductase